MYPVIAIVGPTSSGKTEFSINLADTLKGEIIISDSRQIYQNLDLGTGKPTPSQMTKIRHHLVSISRPEQAVSAEDYANLALSALSEIQAREKTCLVVGGTGLWIRAFLDGLSPVPAADPALRKQLIQQAEAEGNEALLRQLREADPETAEKLSASDRLRIVRALEIYLQTGEKPSVIRKKKPQRPPIQARWIGMDVPRAELYRRSEKRIDEWISQGWLEEVKQLLNSGVSPHAPAMQAIGYSHLVKHLQGEFDLTRAIELIKRDTRHYIKRQLTWFKADKRVEWVDPSTHPRNFGFYTK